MSLTGVCVAVSVFTLVSISLERYFAICQPLRSRRWQTLSHSYRMIGAVWVLSLVVAIPIAVYQKLVPLKAGNHKCIEFWDNLHMEQVYTVFLDLVLLVFPLILMLAAYGKITYTLYKGMKLEIRSAQGKQNRWWWGGGGAKMAGLLLCGACSSVKKNVHVSRV